MQKLASTPLPTPSKTTLLKLPSKTTPSSGSFSGSKELLLEVLIM